MEDPIPFTDAGLVEATSRRVTAATPDAAWRAVVDATPGLSAEARTAALTAVALVTPPAAYLPGLHITASRRVIAQQGGWWYRGVTSVEAHPGGALVTYVVVNIAPGWGRWVAHVFQARAHRRELARQAALDR